MRAMIKSAALGMGLTAVVATAAAAQPYYLYYYPGYSYSYPGYSYPTYSYPAYGSGPLSLAFLYRSACPVRRGRRFRQPDRAFRSGRQQDSGGDYLSGDPA